MTSRDPAWMMFNMSAEPDDHQDRCIVVIVLA